MQKFDFLIIGSGFGGSVSAMRLSQKGYKVAVLESGKRLRAEDFPKTNWDIPKFLWAPGLRCFGLQRISFLKGLLLLHGAGVGGGSLVYANVLVPPTDDVFNDPSWPKSINWKNELAPCYETAKRMLGVTKNPTLFDADEVLKSIAERMGVGASFHATEVGTFFGEPEKTVPDPYFGGYGPPRTGCRFCGGCIVGCRYHSKNTLDYNYLYFAEAWGASIIPETTARRITPFDDGYMIETERSTKFFRPKGETFYAKNVILSAGVLGTLKLLFENRDVFKTLPNVSKKLGDSVRTNGDSLTGVTRLKSGNDFSKGVAIASAMHLDKETMIEAVRYPDGSGAMKLMAVPLTDDGGRFVRPLKFIFVLVTGFFRFLRLLFAKNWARRSIIFLTMRSVDQKMKLIWGRSIHTGFRRGLKGTGALISGYLPAAQRVTKIAASIVEGEPQNSATEVLLGTLTTAHILGGAVIAESLLDGVVDLKHEVFGHVGLYVCDGSVVPANLGANPSLTITAMAERFANQFSASPNVPQKVLEERMKFKIESVREMKPFGWGDPGKHFSIKERDKVSRYLRGKFSIDNIKDEKTDWNLNKTRVNDSTLPADIIALIKEKIGAGHFSTDKNDRLTHAFGKSYKDLIRMRGLNVETAPDIVFYPSGEEDIKKILDICQKESIAVVPFSGGTDVVSGLDAEKGGHKFVAAIDLRGFNKLLAFDETSRIVTVAPGMYGADLERILNSRGYTLGHFPQSFEYSTVGGWISTRASGQNSIKYGNIEDMVVSLKVITPSGIIETATAPAMACGPDIKQILIGSEGIFGIISACTLKISVLPKRRDYFALIFRSFKEAVDASRAIAQSDLRPSMVRVSDSEETESMFALRSESRGLKKILSGFVSSYLKRKGYNIPGSSIMIVGLEGDIHETMYIRHGLPRILRGYSYFNLGRSVGEKWLAERFSQPYLRDLLLDNDLLVDTFETATTWDKMDRLYDAVRSSIEKRYDAQNVRGVIFTHVSHLYETGASLYFTVVANQIKSAPLKQWEDIKTAASEAIVGNGGVISHHHGIGLDHKRFLNLPDTARALLCSMKRELDPSGIMNPGKII